MAKQKAGRVEKALAEVGRLRANQRKDFIKILIALAVVMVCSLGKTSLEVNGIIEGGNPIAAGALLLSAFCMAAFAGYAGRDWTKSSRGIDEACQRAGIAKSDLRTLSRR